MKLDDYRKKRDATRTPEPVGAEPRRPVVPTMNGAYVVHLHDASRRHYDLRLEAAGVLASFAVPKGPSFDIDAKHLAVHTEDHPIEYLDFEGVIPDGNYGAGPMIVWDRGQVRYLDFSSEEGLEKGKIDFVLTGFKLRGRFALVRLKDSQNEWLLFKKRDAFASKERDILHEAPRSVLSGLTVEELGEAPAIARRIEDEAAALGAPARSATPAKLVPMLCGGATPALDDPSLLYELKLDGVRILAEKEGPAVRLRYRSGRDATASYPEIARALASLSAERVVLDGEIVAFDEGGRPSFQRLGRRIHLTRASDVRRAVYEVPVVYVVFDLLALGEHDLTSLPLEERKRFLRELCPGSGVFRVLDHLVGSGSALLDFCRAQKLEGLIAKRRKSLYIPGPRRTDDWLKVKCERDEDFVIVGYTVGEGARRELGALDIATYEGDRLVVRGKVGSGLDDATVELLLARLGPLVTTTPTAEGDYQPAPKGRTHVRPELVTNVRFLGWSEDGHARFPVFRGLREDLPPTACTAIPHADGDAERRAPETVVEDANAPAAPSELPTSTQARPMARFSVTNRNKIFWPELGLTKGDLVAYYEAVAPVLLPYLKDRPVVLVRYPDGVHGKSFFQWNVPVGLPSWVQTMTMPARRDDKHTKTVFLVRDTDSLLYLANLACIPIHILAFRTGAVYEACDFLTLDFDLKGASFTIAIDLARSLHEILEAIGLPGFPKTSGQTGLHVLVPLGPGVSFDTAKALADLLGRLLVERHPRTATMERIVEKRGGKVLVDTGQTGPARTIVAPYSVRASPRATVSTPVTWDEVTPALDPALFTMQAVAERTRSLGDPMASMLGTEPDVASAVARLGQLLGRK